MTTRLVTADSADGTFSSWGGVTNPSLNAVGYVHPSTSNKNTKVLSDDPDCGYINRLQLDDGDTIEGQVGERCVLTSQRFVGDRQILIGQTRWCAFSVKFDASYPLDRADSGWGTFHGRKDAPGGFTSTVINYGGWPPSQAGVTYAVGQPGFWWMGTAPQNPPYTPNGPQVPIFKMPIAPGQWQDIKYEVKVDRVNGILRVWRNGVPQVSMIDGTTTFNGQTCHYSGAGLSWTAGGVTITGQDVIGLEAGRLMIYRGAETTGTEIMSFANYREASTESGL
jgi:hypothetical protein